MRLLRRRPGAADRCDRPQHIAHDLGGRRRGAPARRVAERDQPIDIGEQAIGVLQDSPEISQENLVPAVLRLFGEQLAIPFDRVQRGSQIMAQLAAIHLSAGRVRRVHRGAIDDPLDQ